MPLVAPPNRGYSDYQRVDNWDGPVVWNLPSTTSGGTLSSGRQDVSRYGYVGGVIGITAGVCQANVSWYDDAAGTHFLGGRTFPLHSSIGFPMQLRLPNLGPYFEIGLSAIPGQGNFTVGAFLISTNRTHPLEFIPDQPQLVFVTGLNVNAGAVTPVWFGDYFAGPARVSAFSTQNAAALELDTLSTSGATTIFDKITLNAGLTAFDTVVPPGACLVQMVAAAGANTGFSVYITGSLTGG